MLNYANLNDVEFEYLCQDIMSSLKKETSKVKTLNPKQYYICCSKELSPDKIREIWSEKGYRTIITRRNYNPRIIEFISNPKRFEASGYTD